MADISAMLEIEAVCDRFEAALQQGNSPRIEDYLDGWEGSARDDLLKHLLELEIDRLSNREETLPVQSYRQRFADQIHIVERLVGSENSLRQIIEQLGQLSLISNGEQLLLLAELDSGQSSMTTESLCRRLVAQRQLTEYQAQTILRGELDRLVLGDYLILDKLGQGGMGIVYRARQPGLNRQVALKTILSRDQAGGEEIRRFRQEAESAARLHHPGIVPVFDSGEVDGIHFFAMEFVEGSSLSARLAESAMAPPAAARLVQQLAEAVAYAHLQGVIHRDLKPANILLASDGTPRITDFGLAKLADREGHTVTGDVLGTPSYMPPEQAIGKAGAAREAADIYSLGAILYACLCGHPPFKAETVMATLKLVVEQPPVPPRQFNQQLPVDLETICLKCLEKDPAQRYPAAANLAKDLQRYLSGEPILARPISRLERIGRWSRRNPWIAGLSVLAMLLLAVGTIVSSYFAVLASQRAARAEEGTRIAIETLETVLFQMQDKLASIPAAREARLDVLKHAMKEMQKLADLQVSSGRLDFGRAVVLTRYAAIIFNSGSDDALGSMDTAEKYLSTAREIFERHALSHPKDRQLRLEWAFALFRSGDVAISLGKLDRAREFTDHALQLYRELHAEEPEEVLWKRQLAYTLIVAGDVAMGLGDAAGALVMYRECRDLSQPLCEAYPDNPEFHESLISAIEKMADAQLRLGDSDSAHQLYEENLQRNLDHVEKDPTDSHRLYSLSFCYERLAESALRRNQPETSAEYYHEEVETLIRTIEADPKNRRYQQEIQFPLGKLTALFRQLKRDDDAAAIQANVQTALNRVQSP